MSHELDHPCKDTCSGWKQGYERGCLSERAKQEKIYVSAVKGRQDFREAFRQERQRSAKLVEALKLILKTHPGSIHLGIMGVHATATEAIAEYERKLNG